MKLLEFQDCRMDLDSENIRCDVANFVLFHFMMIGADSHGYVTGKSWDGSMNQPKIYANFWNENIT